MFETEIRITFLSDWQVGSGLGDGAIADNILARDDLGIPWLPGRVVKGALREGAWRLGLCRSDLADLVDWLFGTQSDERTSNTPGRIKVGAGRLPEEILVFLKSCTADLRKDFVGDMTLLRAQTALDKNKMVVPHSLRTMECGIPGLYFTSSLSLDAPEGKWLEDYLAAVCAAVRSMGADRARGLGNCRIEPKRKAEGRLKLPGPCPFDIAALKTGKEAM